MPRTFFTDLTRSDGAPVVVEYSFRGGSPTTYSPLSGPEIEIVRAWLKVHDDNPDAPNIMPTDAEIEAWTDLICESHVDEPYEDDW